MSLTSLIVDFLEVFNQIRFVGWPLRFVLTNF